MKTFSLILFSSLLFVSFSCVAQSDTAKREYNWEVGIKLNSFRSNIPDLYKAVQGGTQIGWDEELVFNPYYRDNSISWGLLLKKNIKSCSINLRADFFKLNKESVYGPYTNNTDTTSFSARLSLTQNVFTISPQIEFTNEFNRTTLVYGFELPLTFYGNANFSQTNETEKNGQLLRASYWTGELAFGNSMGVGMFAGFDFNISKSFSIGGIFFSSIDYYVNSKKSFTDERNVSQFNPLMETNRHVDEELNFKAVVFSPVNLSFIISYKIK